MRVGGRQSERERAHENMSVRVRVCEWQHEREGGAIYQSQHANRFSLTAIISNYCIIRDANGQPRRRDDATLRRCDRDRDPDLDEDREHRTRSTLSRTHLPK